MAIEHRTDHVSTTDGDFDLHVWLPASGSGPGILLLQEIFGVGPYIRLRAEELAALGYVVAAPDVFWRLQPNWASEHTPEGLQASFGLVKDFDFPQGVQDCLAALSQVQAMPETGGRVAAMGFCLGGTLAYFMAALGEPTCAISYYGSGIAGQLALASEVTCPIVFHFGGNDGYIPTEQVEAIMAAFDGRPDATVIVQAGAGHAFDNVAAPMFWNPDAAAAAWEVTTAFLAEHLSVA
jgi:carboxymethylenebutenolidase